MSSPDNSRWIDSEYDGKAETKKIQAFSDEYFALLKSDATFAKAQQLLSGSIPPSGSDGREGTRPD